MKRQLLETTDWAAVGAARPVQVAFTPEEELEQFGKRRRLTEDDHARLNTDTSTGTGMPPRPHTREGGSWDGNVPDNMEIRMDGRRLGQQSQNAVANESSQSQSRHNAGVSSQPMLLDEESFGSASGQRGDAGNISQNRNSARSVSGLSILSTNPQSDYISENPFMRGPQVDDQGRSAPILLDSMDWVADERMKLQQSNESSSIIPQPESPVRRRFTIDEQAVAERERFLASSPVAEPSANQLLYHGQAVQDSPQARQSFQFGFPEAHMRAPLATSPQRRSMLDIRNQWNDMAGLQAPPAPRLAFSQLAWASQDITQDSNATSLSWSNREESISPRSMPRPGNNQFARASMAQIQDQTNMAWRRNEEERASPIRAYGQAVVFEDSGIDANGRARRLSELLDLDSDANHNPSDFSGSPSKSPRRVHSSRFD